jgi:MIP family channel proteins
VDYEDDDERIDMDAVLPPPPDRGAAAFMAEFIGSLALVFFITLTLSTYLPAPPAAGQPQVVQPFIDFSVIGLVHVFVLFMLIQTLGFVSGAHVNPAVTSALLAIRQIKPIDAAIYIVLQLAGGVAGALLTKLFLKDEGDPVHYGATGLSSRISEKALAGFGLEAIGTFFLVWAIVGVAVNPRAFKPWAGLVIAGTLGFAVMAIGPLTGAGLNPARAFGPELVSGELSDEFGKWLLAYVAGPIVGGIAAAFTYFYLVLTPGRKEAGLMEGPVS